MTSVNSFSLAVVLSGGQQTGGGYHQSVTNLRMLLANLPEGFSVSIVDARGSFSRDLLIMREEGLLQRSEVLIPPKKLPTLRDRLVSDKSFPFRIIRALFKLVGVDAEVSVLARFLDTGDADLVYFTSPAPEAAELMQKPFIWTLWDLCHLDSPEFPEVRTSGKFESREVFNSRALRKAAAVVADSAELIAKAREYFGVRESKFVTIPFAPPASRLGESPNTRVLPTEVAELSGKYFFYPAQLWTHKNHLRIAEAIGKVRDRGYDLHAVFVGKDHGAGEAIRREISVLGVAAYIHFLGYVEDQEIPALYENSVGLVMASYFGPTNIPPVEAMLLKTPIIASEVHREQLGDAAIFFNPDDASELAEGMIALVDTRTRERLIARGEKRLKYLDKQRESGQRELVQRILTLQKRLLSR